MRLSYAQFSLSELTDRPLTNDKEHEMRHIVETKIFTRPLIEALIARADILRTGMARAKFNPPNVMYVLFWQPSTRTRLSFQTAGEMLGLTVIGTENASEFSSTVKGETLEDTIRVICEYAPGLIVMRHNEVGAAARAAEVSNVPIINAGDGAGQHPTQALLDVYTIKRELGHLDNITVVIGGDLAYGRTVRSLAYLLSKFDNVRIIFVAPESLRVRDDIKDHLRERGVEFSEEEALDKVLAEADIVYWTRIQRENLPDVLSQPLAYGALQSRYSITPHELALMKPTARILHPLPRNAEISTSVDNDPRAAYFRQAGNGLWIRLALMEWVLQEK